MTKALPLALLALLLACDSGTSGQADAKADAKAVAGADARVAANADMKATVDARAAADAANAAANAAVNVTVPELKAVADVEAALGKKIVVRAADLELNALADLVARGEVKSAAELELLLNAPGAATHRVDLDADGKLDYLQVVEVRADAAVNLEIRAIPSSKLDASLAVLVATLSTIRAEAEGAVKVVADYGAADEGGADIKIERVLKARFDAGAVALAEPSAGAFVGWAFDVKRPAYVSTHIVATDIAVAADGGIGFTGDAGVALAAAQLAALRAAFTVDVAADLAADARADARAELDAAAKAKLDAEAKLDAKLDAASKARADAKAKLDAAADKAGKLEADLKSGLKVGGGISVGGSVGGSAGGKAGGSAGGKAGGSAGGSAGGGIGIKIGK